MKFKKVFLYLISALVFFYFLICTYIYIVQRNILYRPEVIRPPLVEKLNTKVQEIQILSTDNISLKSWFYKNNQNKYTVLFLHGNNGNLETRIYKINEFKNLNLNYLIISWRGFNGNSGKPTEQGLYDDARNAVKWLEKNNIPKNRIILYGESLGTGVAAELAQNEKFAAVVLESPYTSIVEVAKIRYPYLPVDLLLKDKFLTIEKMKNISAPVFVIHGILDGMIPVYMGKKVLDEVKSKKYGYFPELNRHMIRYDSQFISELKKFIKSLN
jgi:fermentation-respiration switch protein FrsA (DUF1100 family)